MIYGIFLNVPEKVARLVDDARKTIGRFIASGDVLNFVEARYKGDTAFIAFARSRRAAARVYDEFKEWPVHVKIIEIEGQGD
ncbi:MAG: hypothetical protein GXO00_02720 [Candidatus Diapherotrites archaeon]|nr:hypothetical protein [Candidatus Diapherotrites archaeon]